MSGLEREAVLVLGHNLDVGVDCAGSIAVNKREVHPVGVTWQGFQDRDQPLRPAFGWVSRYGSVTWSSQGRDLPDGSINDAAARVEKRLPLSQAPARDLARNGRGEYFAPIDEAIVPQAPVESGASRTELEHRRGMLGHARQRVERS